MKGIIVIMDGVSDEPHVNLHGKTPLEAAATPNLDHYAKLAKLYRCSTVKEGYVPESQEGVLSLLGYNSFEVGRGALEAMGLGQELKNGELAFRANFATIDDLSTRNVLDRRAGRTLTTKEARILSRAINDGVFLQGGKYSFRFIPGVQHRGVLILSGGFSDNISDVRARSGKYTFSKGLDEDDGSALTAELVNEFARKAYEVLDKHPLNKQRAKKGLFSANALLLRGAESDRLHLKKLKGNWMALGYMPLERGIAKATHMEEYKFKLPRLTGTDVYGHLHSILHLATKYAIKMIRRNKKKIDYFYVHFKETDIPGHDNKPLEKVKMIEHIDKHFFGPLKKTLNEETLIVTADHTTSCRKKAHTSDPVPLLYYSGKNGKAKQQRFTETDAHKEKKILGKNVLTELFYQK